MNLVIAAINGYFIKRILIFIVVGRILKYNDYLLLKIR